MSTARTSINAARSRNWLAQIRPFGIAAIVATLLCWPAQAQPEHSDAAPQNSGLTTQSTDLIQTVREATAQFQDPADGSALHYSKRRTASGRRRFTPCTYGRGRAIPALSSTGTLM